MDLALFVHKPLQPLMEVSQTGGIVMRDSTTFGCVRPTPDFRSPLLKRPRSGAAQGAGVKRGTGETGTETFPFRHQRAGTHRTSVAGILPRRPAAQFRSAGHPVAGAFAQRPKCL